MGHYVYIQTALKPFKKIEQKFKYILMTILGLAESFKMMSRPDPTRPDPTITLFDAYFSESI